MHLKNEKLCQEVSEQKILITILEAEKDEHLDIIENLRKELYQDGNTGKVKGPDDLNQVKSNNTLVRRSGPHRMN